MAASIMATQHEQRATAPGPTNSDGIPAPRRQMRLRRLAAALALLALVVAAFLLWRAQRGKAVAAQLMEQQAWAEAQTHLARYLWLHPADAEATLMMATAMVNEDVADAQRAIDMLVQVPDDSPHAAEARVLAARLLYTLSFQPERAETLLEEAVRLEPDSYEAYNLWWIILDTTERAFLSESVFRRVLELGPDEHRPARLREWFASQMHTRQKNSDVDRQLGFLGPNEAPSSSTEYRRLITFTSADPQSPVAAAALARWFLRGGGPQQALEIVEPASALPGADNDPFFVATLVTAYIDLGRVDDAERWMEAWPGAREGYEYWKLRGMLYEEASGRFADAADAYQHAVALWPGPVDWRTQYRLAHVLELSGQPDEAQRVREQALRVQQLTNGPNLNRLMLEPLTDLSRPNNLDQLASFYDALGRRYEADAWRAEADRLRIAGAARGLSASEQGP